MAEIADTGEALEAIRAALAAAEGSAQRAVADYAARYSLDDQQQADLMDALLGQGLKHTTDLALPPDG